MSLPKIFSDAKRKLDIFNNVLDLSTLFIVLVFGVYCFILVPFGILFAITSLCFEISTLEQLYQFLTVLFTVPGCAIPLVVVVILKWCTQKIYGTFAMKSYYQCICDINIGFGVVLALGYAPAIRLFFVEPDVYFNCYSFIIYPITSIFFFLFFLLDYGVIYKKDPNFNEAPISMGMAVTYGLILMACSIAFEDQDKKKFDRIMCYQMWFFVFRGPFSIVYMQFLVDLIYYKKVLGQESVIKLVEKVVYVEKEVDNDTKIECKICLRDYSDNLIPRVLTECGHTICDDCANELLRNNFKRFLMCPFCQEITAVNGPANLLARNQAVLDMVNAIKE